MSLIIVLYVFYVFLVLYVLYVLNVLNGEDNTRIRNDLISGSR